jgi:AcrR family transcriptional regulator
MVRGAAREAAILAAVVDLLAEVGYEGLTMDAVAARAHASKTTIYRRWAAKPELVRAALDTYIAGRVLVVPDTGSLRGDLHAVLRALRDHLTPEFLAMMNGLVRAAKQDPTLTDGLQPSALGETAVAEEVLGRAVTRGELADTRLAPLVHEVIEAHVLRRITLGADLDDEFGRHVVDDIVLPLIAGSATNGKD